MRRTTHIATVVLLLAAAAPAEERRPVIAEFEAAVGGRVTDLAGSDAQDDRRRTTRLQRILKVLGKSDGDLAKDARAGRKIARLIKTESVWDDTDMVHVVQPFTEVVATNLEELRTLLATVEAGTAAGGKTAGKLEQVRAKLAEYDALFQDGKLDVTIGIGFDERDPNKAPPEGPLGRLVEVTKGMDKVARLLGKNARRLQKKAAKDPALCDSTLPDLPQLGASETAKIETRLSDTGEFGSPVQFTHSTVSDQGGTRTILLAQIKGDAVRRMVRIELAGDAAKPGFTGEAQATAQMMAIEYATCQGALVIAFRDVPKVPALLVVDQANTDTGTLNGWAVIQSRLTGRPTIRVVLSLLLPAVN